MKCWDSVAVGLILVGSSFMVLTTAGCGGAAQPTEGATTGAQVRESKGERSAASQGQTPAAGKGMAAIQQAADASRYLFVFFSKAGDEQTLAMRKVFDAAAQKVADRANGIAVDITDAAEKAIVDKFDLERAPMPLVLALAPNGAITGGFPSKFEEKQLLEAFVSPATEKCMKSLQDGKLVFLCIQNAKTKSNDAAMKGVNDFKADERFGHATTVITLDPTDKKEAAFLADLQLAPEITEATTVFLVPPGRPVAKYEGATDKQTLVDTLGKANTGCGPGGCGPGGCGPKK
jgi:hypothetical protein